MMKKVLFMLAVCWMGTSCAAKYGCPYSMAGVDTAQKGQTVTFVKTVPAAGETVAEPANMSDLPCD